LVLEKEEGTVKILLGIFLAAIFAVVIWWLTRRK